ncbi:MAG: hypothetical protein Q4P18_03180 [Methanobrevibacter sp.]|uniref:McrB family protein n=1 Tax=Methanobrevibacter sp. TaxID=66852 RepID=UPI0026DF4F66|nr:hypothetical protein [Methanobrevibacter sp.]MDO5848515.1 hypothetical protein [Methanobrevibacter sp.]
MEEYLRNNDYVSVEDWEKILKNPNIITEKMMAVLEIVYNSKDHAATTSQIAEKRNEQGFEDEKSYNSAIVQNGRRIRNYLQREHITDEDGNVKLWPWFFTGKWIGNEFQFKMRDELVEAFSMLNDNNESKEFSSFMDYLKSKGYLFDPEIIENYLLSLKIKPFVIFTGNSGTGKTKLAQLFVDFISKSTTQDYIESSVKVGKSAKIGGWAVSREDVDKKLPILKYEQDYPIVVDGIHGEGKLNMNTRLFYTANDELTNHLERLAEENPNQKIDLKIILSSNKNNQYELVPVGANWTESRNILGFYNVITDEYNSTPAFELIKEAQENPTVPYFLILDEMNLSHVERYFAEFLSAMESLEPIPISATESVKIPENLFIVGTVNVDETTYMFSPKVLDRANTIEFKTMSALDYMNSNFNDYVLNGNETYLLNPQSDEEIRKMNIHELKKVFSGVTFENQPLWDILSNELENFQNVLKRANFDFGFRVINEILRFMVVSWKYENKPAEWGNWQRYFDAQIKQKMLPKLHGSQKVLGPVIVDLFKLSVNADDSIVPRLANVERDNSKYYTSALKLKEMDENLNNQRYTSFVN